MRSSTIPQLPMRESQVPRDRIRSMMLNEDQKVHIFCAVLQAVIASATKGDQSLTPEALVKEAVHFTKEAIATANSSELLKMT